MKLPGKKIFLISGLCLISLISVCRADQISVISGETTANVESTKPFFQKDPRFVLVPNPISNPNIGSGLALAGLYLHDQKKGDTVSPTSITGIAGLYTDTKSWGMGMFHSGYYSQDRFRISLGVFYGSFNLKFYGIGEDSFFRERPLKYEASGYAVTPKFLVRLPLNNWFLGMRYIYLEIDNTFDLSSILPFLPEFNVTTKTAGLGAVLVYDTRDNNLWPTNGKWFEYTVTSYDESFGGDFDYLKHIVKFSRYFPLGQNFTGSYRADIRSIDGNAPFYDLAGLTVRGFASGRYSDNHAASLQVETRWNLHERWTALVFGGGGRIAPNFSELKNASTYFAGGFGFRYMIVKGKKLNIGIDITQGEGETEFYVQIGDYFGR